METKDYVESVKDQLTGFGTLESELSDDAYVRIINTALQELNRYYNGTELAEVKGSACIDLKEYPEISTVVHVYRTEGVGYSTNSSHGEADPVYMSQLQMFNFGSTAYSSSWVSNYGSYSSAQRISNTLSTDLAFKEDKTGQKLYINLPQGIPDVLSVEYIPYLRDASQVKGEHWQDILLRLSLAHAKIALGRVRTRFTQSSGAVWTSDGETILNEGKEELTTIRESLRTANDYFTPID